MSCSSPILAAPQDVALGIRSCKCSSSDLMHRFFLCMMFEAFGFSGDRRLRVAETYLSYLRASALVESSF